MRVCSKCKVEKPLESFCKNRAQPGGHDHYCKACKAEYHRKHFYFMTPELKAKKNTQTKTWRAANPEKLKNFQRKHRLKKKYGLSPEQVDTLIKAQNGVCKVCGLAPGGKGFVIDHDHANGKVRGMLCSQCNTALGLLKESVDTILALAAYLNHYQKNKDEY